jgi:hypothetical protein
MVVKKSTPISSIFTKKSNLKSKNSIEENLEEAIEGSEKILEFPTIETYADFKFDFNWVSVRRKIQRFNIFKCLLKDTKEEKAFRQHKNIKKFLYDLFIVKYQYDVFWKEYCIWFNKVVNKK